MEVFKGVLSSSILWMFITLMIVDLCVAAFRPLRFVSISGIVLRDQDSVGERIEKLLSEPNQARILFLGTSLAEELATNADIASRHVQLNDYQRGLYTRSEYFDSLVKEKLAFNHVANSLVLGVSGGLISGNALVVKHLLEKGKAPGVLVWLVAPRAFIDSTHPVEFYPVHNYLEARYRPINLSTGQLFNSVSQSLSRNWRYFSQRGDYAVVLSKMAEFYREHGLMSQSSGKSEISFQFKPDGAMYDPDKPLAEEELASVAKWYSNVYSSYGEDRLLHNLTRFRETLRLCNENNILCLVVGMPIGRVNRELMPESLKAKYKRELSDICGDENTRVVFFFDDDRFDDSDFRDYVHLNGRGAIKFWNLFVDELKKDQSWFEVFRKQLSQ